MKTWLITTLGTAVLDSAAARIADFKHLQQFTGDEWTADIRERFAERYAWDAEDDRETLFHVSYDDRAERSTESFPAGPDFHTMDAAVAWAESENQRLQREYIQNESNFAFLHLPDGWTPEIGPLRTGDPYPLSRRIACSLEAEGFETNLYAEREAHWQASGVTDTWLQTFTIRDALVDLIDGIVAEAATQAAEAAS